MLKPLHVKISEEAIEILERVHSRTDIPKSRLVERGIRSVAKDYADIPKALKLLRAIEEADQALAEGRVRSWEEIKYTSDELRAIDHLVQQGKTKAKGYSAGKKFERAIKKL